MPKVKDSFRTLPAISKFIERLMIEFWPYAIKDRSKAIRRCLMACATLDDDTLKLLILDPETLVLLVSNELRYLFEVKDKTSEEERLVRHFDVLGIEPKK